ncbi:MAG: molybdopterin molybdotransferase MoeA [Myxacorys californica WJT36-NPBG1]|jgi:molybdopterin molybdotransferase|nr:molybdopterin molybdotransferase MoeA [Myxacorys californica WJT36-NPBG1]
MLPAQEAEALILEAVQALDVQQDVELVELEACHDRILASPVTSRLDFPHWDNSAMDGYAVRFEDVKSCSADQPAVLEVIEEIPAGYQPQKSVQPGQAARILTGSVMPTGADTIVIQEHTQRQAETVLVLEPPSEPQAFVRHQGAFHKSGEPLLSAGIVLKAPEIAVLAAAQCVQVPVFRRVRVAILSTGDELVSPEQPLQPGQIVDSNQYALAALVAELGAEPLTMGIVQDDPDRLNGAIASAIQSADIILSSGGVSVGDYDYVDRILAELGAEIHIRSVAIKPGKPLTFATFPNTLYFGLPGNPVSALVTFWRFVQPAILKRSGLARDWKPRFIKAITTQDLRSDGKRESYLWGNVEIFDGAYRFTPAGGSSSSGNLINLAGTNALGVVAIASSNSEASAQTHVQAGDTIQMLLTYGK